MEQKGRFWLWVLGVALAVGIGGFLVFALIGWAWYAWGFFGMLLFFAVVLLGFAWVYDKRQQRAYED
jgi:bacteriorhodopsin